MKKNTNQLKVGSILSYIQMALNIIIGLVYTPIMIKLLGQSEYGLYNTAASTISMLSVLNLGFNSSYIKYYAGYKSKNEQDSISKLNGLFLTIFIALGAVVLLCGIVIITHLELVFSNGLTSEEYRIARILMTMLVLNLSLSFPMSVFSNIISAHERFVFLKGLGIVKNVVSPLVTLPLLLIGYRSIAMVAVSVSINSFVDILYVVYVFRKLNCKFVFHVL